MNLQPKQGYLLAEIVDSGVQIDERFVAFKVVKAAPVDVGVIAFVPAGASIYFADKLHLIRIEDVLVFVKPEASELSEVVIDAAA